MIYDATSLDAELRAAGLPILGCSSAGRIDWDGHPTAAQAAAAEKILAAQDPTARERIEAGARDGARAARDRIAARPGAADPSDAKTVLLWLARHI